MILSFRFITPCFCAGADQYQAEVRSASIRGALRWWFRCLGGTLEEENSLFGNAAGRGYASAVRVGVRDFQRSDQVYSPGFISPNDSEAYLHYLLTAPNDHGRTRMWKTPPDPATKTKGIIRPESQIPPDSVFSLDVRTIRAIPDHRTRELLAFSIDCLAAYGSLGYRRSRGFGAWSADATLKPRKDLLAHLENLVGCGFSFSLAESANTNPLAILRQVETALKGNKELGNGLRLHHKAASRTPLGFSHGPSERQASAVYFRPCAYLNNSGGIQYSLLTFQAPDSVLGSAVKGTYGDETRLI